MAPTKAILSVNFICVRLKTNAMDLKLLRTKVCKSAILLIPNTSNAEASNNQNHPSERKSDRRLKCRQRRTDRPDASM
jgi:hypothetical protein